MATMGEEAKPKIDRLIDQVDKNRREMSETQMYAKLILSRVGKLEGEVAALMEKCLEPDAAPSADVEVIDLEEEEVGSGGMNQGQRPQERGMNDDLRQFKEGMRKDCGNLQDDVDNLLKLVQLLLANRVMRSGSKTNAKLTNPESAASTNSVEPSSRGDGRRSPTTSAARCVKTEEPSEDAETAAFLNPDPLLSTGDAGCTGGLEGINEGGISTTTGSLDMASGGGKISNGPAWSSSTSTFSPKPTSNVAGRKSPMSAVGIIETGNPTGRAENGRVTPTSLDSTGDIGVTAGLEGNDEDGISTTTDPLDMTVGGGQNSTGALKKKRIPCKINSEIAVVPQETDDPSIHKRKRRIRSKPADMGVFKRNTTPRTTKTLREAKAKPPPKQLEVGNRTRVGDVTSGEPDSVRTDFDTTEGSNDAPTSPPVPSTHTQELLSATGDTSPKETGVNNDDHLATLEINSQSSSAIGTASSSLNNVSSSLPLPPLKPTPKQANIPNARELQTPANSEPRAGQHSSKGNTPWECIFCHKNLSTKQMLEYHILSHIGERSHFCHLCPYESCQKGSLDHHLKTHHNSKQTGVNNDEPLVTLEINSQSPLAIGAASSSVNNVSSSLPPLNATLKQANTPNSRKLQTPDSNRIRCRINSAVAVVPQETEEESSIHDEATDTDDTTTGNETPGNHLKMKKRRIGSNPDMGVPLPRGKRTSRTSVKLRVAKSPAMLLEVATETRVDVSPGRQDSIISGFNAIGGSSETPTVPTSPPGSSTQASHELLPARGCPNQEKTGANIDLLANAEIESQPVSAITVPATSKNVSPSLECIFCHKKFGFKRGFEEHVLIHIGERPNFCNLCPFETSYKGNLRSHLETHKPPSERKLFTIEKQFKCQICQKRFRWKGGLKRHVTEVHENKRQFKCDHCPKAFPTNYGLKKHMLIHIGEKNHHCVICGQSFTYKCTLDYHIRGHTLERPFKCRFCGESFRDQSGQRNHERRHHHQ